MSLELMEAVWNNPHFTGPETAILVRLAKHANKQGGSIHPGVESLSTTTGFNRRSVLRVLSDAKSTGILIQSGHHGRHPIYTMMKDAVVSFSGDRESPLGVTESHPTEQPEVAQSHFMGDTQSRSSDTQSPSIERARPAHERSSKSQEEKNKIDEPEWLQILDRDPRWAARDRFAEDMEKMFPQLNLHDQAMAAYEWLQTPKGKRRPKVTGMYFLNWLKRAEADRQSTNGRGSTSRLRNTVEDMEQAEREVRGGHAT